MSVPLISNVGFTEVNSSGVLNDKAGKAKSKLPVQIFKLTDNISGNLQMNADSAHKKIILDTTGNNITNSSGSPLTTNSSTTLELKGSGNVQSTLKTFTTSGSSNTTISEADNSTVAITDQDFYSEISQSGGYQPSFGTGAPNSSSIFVIADNQTGGPSNFGSAWRLRVPSGVTWKIGSEEISGGTTLTAAQNNAAIGASSSFNKITSFSATVNDNPNIGDNTTSFPASGWTSGFNGDSNIYLIRSASLGVISGQQTDNYLVYNVTNGRWEGYKSTRSYNVDDNNQVVLGTPSYSLGYADSGRRGNTPPPQLITLNINVEQTGKRFTFTNNLSISCVLSGNDPYNGVTVSAGSTAVSDRNSSDTSFIITGTISGSDGSSRPFALKDINDGSGSVDETAYTGTKSVSAF